MSVKGSFSVHFTYAGGTVLLATDITGIHALIPVDTVETYKTLSVSLGISAGVATVSVLFDGTAVDTSDYTVGAADFYDVWIFVYSTTVTVYVNKRWVYTYTMSFVKYVAYTTVASLTTSETLTNIRREEIPDWRDAVYVDYESTGDNALQSVYQQRPVWVFPQPGRTLAFTYHTTKDQIPAHHVQSYSDKQVNVTDASSDGLVYYYDVGVSAYALAAKEIGLVTRLYRLSELDIGGVEAAKTIQEIALEHRNPVDVDVRPDPRIEISDRLIIDLIVTGTLTHITDDVIIEDASIQIEDGRYAMHINGRRNK